MTKKRVALGRRYRLRTGQILEVWSPAPDDLDIKRVCIISTRGANKGMICFTVEDLPAIMEAFKDAASKEEYVDPLEGGSK